uniref:Os08g0170800 protein n=1 Tax=Schistocephalus solidus TaxID=70667 RepID=A0A183T866_SCHSO
LSRRGHELIKPPASSWPRRPHAKSPRPPVVTWSARSPRTSRLACVSRARLSLFCRKPASPTWASSWPAASMATELHHGSWFCFSGRATKLDWAIYGVAVAPP